MMPTILRRHSRSLTFTLASLLSSLAIVSGASIRFVTRDERDGSLPCRIYLQDEAAKAYHPADAPVWEGGFVSSGTTEVDVPVGRYHYRIEKGPEWNILRGDVAIGHADASVERLHRLERIVDLKAEGWYGGDLHVHRPPNELSLHLPAEDLSVASVQTWWNETNPWNGLTPPDPVKKTGDGRFYHVLSGEDERGGGALLFHRMRSPLDITGSRREWPPSVTFLHRAASEGAWVEIEKPFWWDTPAWLATGKIDSVGIAQNHMQREGMLDNEAWGRARDRERYPGPHGNGLYTQDLYYKILNCGLRIPPSAGSASGVLANPVGYNRVYVHLGGSLGWDAWWEGLRAGRSFVTNGPLLRMTANDALPGSVLRSRGSLQLRLEGRLDSREAVAGLEFVHNGKARPITLPTEVILEESGWFLVRAIAAVPETFRFASTAPWYVEVDDEDMKPRRQAATYFLNWARERRKQVANALDEEQGRMEALAPHERALAYWDEVAGRSVE